MAAANRGMELSRLTFEQDQECSGNASVVGVRIGKEKRACLMEGCSISFPWLPGERLQVWSMQSAA